MHVSEKSGYVSVSSTIQPFYNTHSYIQKCLDYINMSQYVTYEKRTGFVVSCKEYFYYSLHGIPNRLDWRNNKIHTPIICVYKQLFLIVKSSI